MSPKGSWVMFDQKLAARIGIAFVAVLACWWFFFSTKRSGSERASSLLAVPSPMMDSSATQKSWPGYDALEYLFVFGDSYSSVGYDKLLRHPDPSTENPLGIEFPGRTYAETGQPNWVGHLVSSFRKKPTIVYDFAVGGNTVKDLQRQLGQFNAHPGAEGTKVPWSAPNSLFVTWIGFNDVAKMAHWQGGGLPVEDSMNMLFYEIVHSLYSAGARNFLFLNVPPLPNQRSKSMAAALAERERNCKAWNDAVEASITEFEEIHEGSTVFLFNAYETFADVLSNQEKYGFSPDSGTSFDGEVYVDNIHPTSRMHKIVAKKVASFLAGREMEENERPLYEAPADQ